MLLQLPLRNHQTVSKHKQHIHKSVCILSFIKYHLQFANQSRLAAMVTYDELFTVKTGTWKMQHDTSMIIAQPPDGFQTQKAHP
jgi:hypothetical protein